jgi:hypothetical protein
MQEFGGKQLLVMVFGGGEDHGSKRGDGGRKNCLGFLLGARV